MITDFITPDEVKQQCYLDRNDSSEDAYLELLTRAAIRHIENFTNRKLYAKKEDIPAEGDDAALIWGEDLKMGALLLIAGWYENREGMTDTKVHSIPFAFHALVGPYKFIPV